MLKKVDVEIKGISPLLMHAFPLKQPEGFEKMSPGEQAEHCTYRDPRTNELFVPAINIQRSLVSAATFSKGRGRSSLQREVAACVIVSPERVGLGTKTYSIDQRAVVVPATKGRIVRSRARFDEWALKFTIEFDATLLKEEQVRRIVDDMGSRVGLLDFRPEKKGPFGRSMVTSWKSSAEPAEERDAA